METCAERRKRKLLALAKEKGGVAVIASDCGMSSGALSQIAAGTLLPAKKDGERREKGLGDDAARAIEQRYGLERGWFDADDLRRPDVDLETSLEFLSSYLRALSDLDRGIAQAAMKHFIERPESIDEVKSRLEALQADRQLGGAPIAAPPARRGNG
jgi:hypothetical protein